MIRLHLPSTTSYLAREEKRDYLLLALGLLSLFLFGFGGIRLLIRDTNAIYAELKIGKAYEAALTEKLAALDKAKTQLSQIQAKLEAINNAIPTSATQADLLEELFNDSTQAGLTVAAITFREQKREGYLTIDSFDLALRGEQNTLTRFLEELEKGRLILLESFSYNRGSTGEGLGEIVLRGKTFIYEQSNR